MSCDHQKSFHCRVHKTTLVGDGTPTLLEAEVQCVVCGEELSLSIQQAALASVLVVAHDNYTIAHVDRSRDLVENLGKVN